MSGWLRIGVALGVLWIIGFPCYLVISTNSQASSAYLECIHGAAHQTSDRAPQTLKNEQKPCTRMRDASTVSFAGLFLDTGPYSISSLLWAIMLIPVAVLWIVGSIVIIALRWIGRGFRA
jgi:hypothetical protein